jgi:hypothetical protein
VIKKRRVVAAGQGGSRARYMAHTPLHRFKKADGFRFDFPDSLYIPDEPFDFYELEDDGDMEAIGEIEAEPIGFFESV